MPTSFKPNYQTSNQAMTITLNSLANGSSAFCTAIDNSSNLYSDYLIELTITAASSSVSATGTVTVLLAATVDGGTTYTTRTQDCKVVAVLDLSANNAIARLDPVSVAQFYGGRCPQKFQVAVLNNSGAALAASPTAPGNTGVYQAIIDQGI